MLRGSLIALVVLVALVAAWGVQLYWVAGEFRTLEPHFDGTCTPVPGAVGPEDITIHAGTGVAYVSAFDRRALLAGAAAPGAIDAYDLEADAPVLVNLTPGAEASFRPHGIGLYAGPEGQDTLFVVNHPASDRHTIEVFELVNGELSHREAIADPELRSPNDVIPVGPDRFYVTNDHGTRPGPWRTLEDYLRLPLANVVYYDGSRFREVASGIRYANGINASPDGMALYVSATTDRRILVYERDPETGALSPGEAIEIGTGADNIEVDGEGRLWVGSHPKLLTFVRHAGDPRTLAPSQVLRISLKGGGVSAVDEVLLNLGDALSGSSVAAVRGQRMLVGAVFDPRFLDCRMN